MSVAWLAACGEDAGQASIVQRGDGATFVLDAPDTTSTSDPDVDATTTTDASTAPDGSAPTDVADVDTYFQDTPTPEVADDVPSDDTGPGDTGPGDTGPGDTSSVDCEGPADCPEPSACWRATCASGTCGVAVDDDDTCSDGSLCTTEDACAGGQCEGKAKVCDDADPCTLDACDPGSGTCTKTPIEGCAVDLQCVGKEAGTPCDDRDATTSADLCMSDTCRGFAATRISASTVPDVAGLVVTEIDHGPDGWSAIVWALEEGGDQLHVLVRIDDPAAAVPYYATAQSAWFRGLHDGFVGDDEGFLWQFVGDEWTIFNDWDDALAESGNGDSIRSVWTTRDTVTAGTRHVWAAGEENGDEWIRYCHDDGAGDTIVCDDQELDDFEPSSIPVAMTGVPSCAADAANACAGGRLALAADAQAAFGTFTDTYENADGEDSVWDKGAVAGSPVNRTSRAIAGWGSADAAQFIVVGSSGYLVHRRADGSWSAPLVVKDGQAVRTFSGAAARDGLLTVIATRPATSGQLAYELWTAPLSKDVELASSWTVHPLVTGPNVSAAGLYDVDIDQGQVRIVGSIRRLQNPDGPDYLDGLVMIRQP